MYDFSRGTLLYSLQDLVLTSSYIARRPQTAPVLEQKLLLARHRKDRGLAVLWA